MDDIGIRVTFDKVEKTAGAAQAGARGQGAVHAATDGSPTIPMARTSCSSSGRARIGQANYSMFDLPEYNALYETRASACPTGPEREALYDRMVKLILVYVPWMVETFKAQNIVMQPWLLNYKKHPFAHEPWRYLDIDLARAPRALARYHGSHGGDDSRTHETPARACFGTSRPWRSCSCSRTSSRIGRGCSSRPRSCAVARGRFRAREPRRHREALRGGGAPIRRPPSFAAASPEGRDRPGLRAHGLGDLLDGTGPGHHRVRRPRRAAGREARRGEARARRDLAGRASASASTSRLPQRGARQGGERATRNVGFKLNVARSGDNNFTPLAQGARRRAARSQPALATSARSACRRAAACAWTRRPTAASRRSWACRPATSSRR